MSTFDFDLQSASIVPKTPTLVKTQPLDGSDEFILPFGRTRRARAYHCWSKKLYSFAITDLTNQRSN